MINARAIAIIVALCAVSAILAAADEKAAGARFQDAYQKLIRADAARDQKDWVEALSFYQAARDEYIALRVRYPDWDPGTTRFRITYAANQVENVFGRFGRRKTTDPVIKNTAAKQRDIAFIVRTSKNLLKRGNHVKARVLLIEGLRYDPDGWSIRMLLGIAQCQAGQFGDAAVIAQQLVRERPEDSASRLLLAGAWYGLARYDVAEAELQDVLADEPDFADAHFNLAQVLLRKEKPDEKAAKKHYRRALELGAAPDAELGSRLRVKPPRRR